MCTHGPMAPVAEKRNMDGKYNKSSAGSHARRVAAAMHAAAPQDVLKEAPETTPTWLPSP